MYSTRKAMPVFRATVWILGLITILGVTTVNAQERDQTATERALAGATSAELGEQAATILQQLGGIIDENADYHDRLAAATAEDSMVLRLQIARVQDDFMQVLHDLAAVIPKLEDDAAKAEVRERAAVVFEEVTPAIFAVISELRSEIDGLRSQRLLAPASERLGLEDRIDLYTKRLNTVFSFGKEHIEQLESLGRDTADERAEFSRLLASRADELSGRIELGLLRIREYQSQIKVTPGDADLTLLLTATSENLQTNVASLETTLDIMDFAGLPTADYRTQLVTATQNIASGVLDRQVAKALLQRGWRSLVSWTSGQGPAMLVKLLLFLAILFVGRLLARLVRKAVTKSLDKANLNISQLLRRMTINFAHNAVLGLALLIALAQLGFSLGPLLAGLGVIGFILGFAMQDSLSNLAAGMMILINRPYDVGDLVEISGVFGKVEQMSMVSTSVLTLDNQKLVVPNSKIWGDVIKNVTDQRIRRVDMVFGISYSDDIPKAEGVLADILSQHDRVLDEPAPMVRVHSLGESSVDFVVRPWVNTDDYWDVHWDVTRAVKMRFDAEDISIPFPQRDVHVYEEKLGLRDTATNASKAQPAPIQSPRTGARDPDAVAEEDDG